ncbi:vomeronasal type-2 receptor 26-like [Pelobates cultripes]|uniref:Vomeronasal type-2 receptor 26-like n=1 Tax=Pelobates cultripes TaxID=61616 RepID=A0AAD1SHZ3_PELCU|nr:vomeronasal type-2 receptor 26-like [Pelobates cultripes]
MSSSNNITCIHVDELYEAERIQRFQDLNVPRIVYLEAGKSPNLESILVVMTVSNVQREKSPILLTDTPIVKANNKNLSFILLVSIMMSFLCVFLFIGRPVDITCMLRQTSFGFIFSTAVSSVLAKTIMVCAAFRATKPNSLWKNWIGIKLSNVIVLFCSSLQVVISISWLTISPPFQELDLQSHKGRIIIQCNEGSVIAFYLELSYMGILAAISFVLAFMVRTLPDIFNEAKYITFSMLVFCSVWIAMLPAYLSTKGKDTVAVEIFAILASTAGLLGCIFLPKCYIILCRPEMNTKSLAIGSRQLAVGSRQYSENCIKCSDNEWSNEKKVRCVPKQVEFLSYSNDVLSLVFSSVSSLCFFITAVILGIFIFYQNTPIVKANNKTLSFILLVSIMLSFPCVFLFLGRPVDITCMLRQTSFGVIFSIAVSSLLAKTIMVCAAFRATKPDSVWRKWTGAKLSNVIVSMCSSLQVVFSINWLAISPPFQELDTQSYKGRIIIQCNEGSVIAFYLELSYMGILAAISFVLAFMVRTLPDSFNEARYITFSMLVFCSVWITMIPAYLSTKGKYMVAVEIFAILASSTGLLGCIFLPKFYIILCRPEMNTKSHFHVLGVRVGPGSDHLVPSRNLPGKPRKPLDKEIREHQLSSLFLLMTAIILGIFIFYQNTPIVKANNKTLSFILLVSIMLSFLCVFLFLGRPVDITCMLRQTSFGVIFSIAVSSVLAKTIMVCAAFRATKPDSVWRKWTGVKLSNVIFLFCSCIQVVVNISWLAISPPFQELDTQSYKGKIIIQCNEGSVIAFYLELGYMGILAAISFVLAFMVRTLPDSFNEAKYITFSMLVFCSVWIAMIPAYLSTKGKYMVAVEIFAILTSSAGLLGCIFLPKCYIILFQDETQHLRQPTKCREKLSLTDNSSNVCDKRSHSKSNREHSGISLDKDFWKASIQVPAILLCLGPLPLYYKYLLIFRFAIEEVNANVNILPNITLGFHIYDSCSDGPKAVKSILQILSGPGKTVPNYHCHGRGQIAGFIGDHNSVTTLPMAQILGVYRYTQWGMAKISYGATTDVLNDRYFYPTFFRTLQSDSTSYSVLLKLLKHFGWTWVGILASNDDSGEKETLVLTKHMTSNGICVAFTIKINLVLLRDTDRVLESYRNIVKESSANIMVICGTFSPFVANFFRETSDIFNDRTLILNPTFAVNKFLLEFYPETFNGSLAVEYKPMQIPDMKRYFESFHPLDHPDDCFLKHIWLLHFFCDLGDQSWHILKDIYKISFHNCTGKERLTDFMNFAPDGLSPHVYRAVHAMAEALHQIHSFLNRKTHVKNITVYNYKNQVSKINE